MEEKKTESERNKDESQKTRNGLKVSDSETYPLKNEERMKNGEEQRKTSKDLFTETLRKCLGLDFLHGNNFPQQFREREKCQEG